MALCLTTCQRPEIEIVDFDTFHVTSVKYSDVIVDGGLNPEIRTMDLGDEDGAKLASISMAELVSHLVETTSLRLQALIPAMTSTGIPSPCQGR